MGVREDVCCYVGWGWGLLCGLGLGIVYGWGWGLLCGLGLGIVIWAGIDLLADPVIVVDQDKGVGGRFFLDQFQIKGHHHRDDLMGYLKDGGERKGLFQIGKGPRQ